MSSTGSGQQLQDKSLPGATRNGSSWEAWEDDYLREVDGRPLSEMAARLHRTYYSVHIRREFLGLNSTHLSNAKASPQEDKPDRILCPCASLDGDHQDWCPSA